MAASIKDIRYHRTGVYCSKPSAVGGACYTPQTRQKVFGFKLRIIAACVGFRRASLVLLPVGEGCYISPEKLIPFLKVGGLKDCFLICECLKNTFCSYVGHF